MLHIILTILKIIGIIIACIIGLLLLIILSVLSVPIRYKSSGYFREDKYAKVVISWFFHLLDVRVIYDKDAITTTIRVFGWKLRRERSSNKTRRRLFSRKNTKKSTEEKLYDIGDSELEEDENKIKNKIQLLDENIEEYKEELEKEIEESDKESDRKQDSWLTKIKRKIVDFIKKILDVISSFIEKIKNTISSIEDIKKLITVWYEYLTTEDNKKSIVFVKGQLIELLKYAKPKRVKADITFGTGNPASTGQILALISIFYVRFADDIGINPDFEKKILRGEYKLRGRIRGIKLLIIAIKLYRNKELMNFINNLPK